MSNIENIPPLKLSISPLNVRHADTDANIEGLAASIKAHGLLQNLTDRARTASFVKLAKLKKAELADVAEAELAAAGWLPARLYSRTKARRR